MIHVDIILHLFTTIRYLLFYDIILSCFNKSRTHNSASSAAHFHFSLINGDGGRNFPTKAKNDQPLCTRRFIYYCNVYV